ncbi:MAG: iron-sulfur cluster assembly scaffold protein [Sedimentisphaerales bacterium]|nr:iron-sulfur cluster assembly scaffold protein [Sedimentisphaerales bacterium]
MENVPDEFFGQMNDPTAGAWLTGPCGDTMEFYLVIEDDRITHVRYHTDGCEYTRLCGRTVARFILDKTLREALAISPAEVLSSVPELPQEHRHCAILAVSTFYKAVAQFWLEQARS